MTHDDARTITSTALGLALVGGVAATIALASAAQADPQPKVTICHATGAEDHWVVITVDAASILDGNGQAGSGRNVIPPFVHTDNKGGSPVSYPGLNWQDNWEVDAHGVATGAVSSDDCVEGESVPEPSATPTATQTSTPSPEVTPTVEPSPTETNHPDDSATATPTPTPDVTETTTAPEVTVTPTPTPEVTVTPTPTPDVTETTTAPEVTVTPTPTLDVTETTAPIPGVTATPSVPTPATTVDGGTAVQPAGPVVETDVVSGPDPALLGAGSALLVLGAGAVLAGTRRGRQHP